MPSTTLEHLRPDQICDEPPALFSLGNVVATPPALALIQKYGASIADTIRILYGGSVKPNNASELFSQPDIDGGLIGGASLVAADFIAIIESAI